MGSAGSIQLLSADEVADGIGRVGRAYEQYRDTAREHDIDGAFAQQLTDQDLAELGVGLGVHR